MTGILKYDPYSAHLNYVKRTGGSPARYDGANRVSSQAFGASLVNDLIDQLGFGSAFSYFRRGDADFVFLFVAGNLGPNGEVNRAVLNAALTAPRVWTLPPANGIPAGWKLTILDAVGGISHTNTLTLQRAGADTLKYPPTGGATTFVMNVPYECVMLVSDGVSAWAIEGGNLPPNSTRTQFWTNVSNGQPSPPIVYPFRERIMVGAASDYSSLDRLGSATFGWLTSATGPNWIPRDSQLGVVQDDGAIAISGATRSSDGPSGTSAIGVAGFAIADAAGPSDGWGAYFEAIRANDTAFVAGIEVDVRNTAAAPGADTPYGVGLGPHGLWIACGPGSGGGGYGPAPVNDSGSAMVVLPNVSGGNTKRFTNGITFYATALSGVNGTDSESTTGVGALVLGRGQDIRWFASNGAEKLRIGSRSNSGDTDWSVFSKGVVMSFLVNSQAETVLDVTSHPGAVNNIRIDNEITGGPPQILVVGADTDIDMYLRPKGAGTLRFGTNTAKGAEAFASFITVKDAGGTPRKLMVCA